MKLLLSIVWTVLSLGIVSAAPRSSDVVEETLYQEMKENILLNKAAPYLRITQFEQKILLDVIWDLADEGSEKAFSILDSINTDFLELSERLRLGILRLKYNRTTAFSDSLREELINALQALEAETKIVYLIAAYADELQKAGHTDIIELASKHPQYWDIINDQERKNDITQDMIADLFHQSPDVTTYMNGEYIRSVKVFMFCRENRLYPCLMVMKNIHGEVLRNSDSTIWTHKALASSARGLPSYSKNGNTPTGVYSIDSVMPTADQQISFGKFRRMIINFIPKSTNETLLKSLLPVSSHSKDWWKPSTTARDIGRNLFRIHGTLKINTDPTVPYYPFMRTSGCIAQRENAYDGVTYQDQRDLLDTIMSSMDLVPNYANELNVKGLLYLVEIDDQNAPVEARDLTLRGIE